MNKGEIRFVFLDPTSGHKQQGAMPVLIVSPSAFNRITQTPVTLPITSGGNSARAAVFPVSLIGCGTLQDLDYRSNPP